MWPTVCFAVVEEQELHEIVACLDNRLEKTLIKSEDTDDLIKSGLRKKL